MGMVGLFGLTNSHLLWTREAYPTQGVPVARQPGARGRVPIGPGPGDPRGIPEGIAIGDPDRIVEGDRAVGVDGR